MFESIISNEITLPVFMGCIGAAMLLGVLTALLFRFRSKNSPSLSMALAVLPAVVTMVIMMVNGNVGAGLAVAGSFALIRFRSLPGKASDIVGLFMATAIGLACGMGYIAIACVYFVAMATFVLLLTLLHFGENTDTYRQLRITIPEILDYDDLFEDIFEKYTTRHELERVKTTNMGTLYELTYAINLKSAKNTKAFIDELRCRNGNLNIVCGKELTGLTFNYFFS